MRYDTRMRLEREVRRRRLRTAGMALAVVTAIVAGFLLIDLDARETKALIAGTVEGVQPYIGPKGKTSGLTVSVKLADGRHVTVLANATRDPHIGDSIDVTEHHHHTGRTTFTLK